MYHIRVLKDDIVVDSYLQHEPIDTNTERELLKNREDHWIDVERLPLKPEDFFTQEDVYESDFECE